MDQMTEFESALQITDPIQFLKALIEILRPQTSRKVNVAAANVLLLTTKIKENEQIKKRINQAINYLISSSNIEHLFDESGILTNSGFFAELNHKLVNKLLPSLLPENDLRIYISQTFSVKTDYRWVNEINTDIWADLFRALEMDVPFDEPKKLKELLHAAETLSYRIAALGLDKRITQNAQRVVSIVNTFVEQNKLVTQYIDLMRTKPFHYQRRELYRKIIEAIHAAFKQVKLIRMYKRQTGTSLQQTFIVERIDQQLHRLKTVLTILDPEVEVRTEEYVTLFKDVIKAEQTENKLTSFLSSNFSYLAYNISEHGGRTGEKYIANDKGEYGSIFKSAAKGGVIISLAALIKIGISSQHMAPFWNSFCIGTNYAIAFVVIHLIHGTIATKQPSLTASTIATALDQPGNKNAVLQSLALMTAKVFRSQLVSLLGNLIIVFPLCLGLGWLFYQITGRFVVDVAKANALFPDIEFHIRNIWFAVIAGILLFLSGLISGYFDNLVIFGNIPERIRVHQNIKSFLGKKKTEKFANYIDKNLGALMGNVVLGFSLGFMIFFGAIFSLPIDIRHVTISTGFYAFSLFGVGYHVSWQEIAWCVSGLAGIALTNLTVSFVLALYVAMKSRRLSSVQVFPLMKISFKYLLRFPGDFVWPPKTERTAEDLKKLLSKEKVTVQSIVD